MLVSRARDSVSAIARTQVLSGRDRQGRLACGGARTRATR